MLFDRQSGRTLAQASGPWAPVEIEQRANAFAAMLLMPEPLLRAEFARLTHELAKMNQLESIADRVHKSLHAVTWHGVNLGLVPRTIAQQTGHRLQGSDPADIAFAIE